MGVITDGDVRRAMQHHREGFFSLRVEEIMSIHPITIAPDAQLAEASELMRQHAVHTLVVVDATGAVRGLIDSFSCL